MKYNVDLCIVYTQENKTYTYRVRDSEKVYYAEIISKEKYNKLAKLLASIALKTIPGKILGLPSSCIIYYEVEENKLKETLQGLGLTKDWE